ELALGAQVRDGGDAVAVVGDPGRGLCRHDVARARPARGDTARGGEAGGVGHPEGGERTRLVLRHGEEGAARRVEREEGRRGDARDQLRGGEPPVRADTGAPDALARARRRARRRVGADPQGGRGAHGVSLVPPARCSRPGGPAGARRPGTRDAPAPTREPGRQSRRRRTTVPQPLAFAYASWTSAAMRPRSLTVYPFAFAHSRTAAVSLPERDRRDVVAVRVVGAFTLRAWPTHEASASRSCAACSALRSIS